MIVDDEYYLKIFKVLPNTRRNIVGILPGHFLVAINGVRIGKLGTTTPEWKKALYMQRLVPTNEYFVTQLPPEAAYDSNTIVIDRKRYAGSIPGWNQMMNKLS